MIGYISGTVRAVHKNYLIVETAGIGYRVFVTPPVLLSEAVGKNVSLYVFTYVREDLLALFGFYNLNELDFFELLLTVSGIGPKIALSIMSLADLNVIKSGIANGDASVFTKVSGVGRKTSERLIVELKDKVGDIMEGKEIPGAAMQAHADMIDVLMALGYSRTEARQAVAALPKDITKSEDKIREALRALARH